AYSWGNHASVGYALASTVTSALAGKVDKVAGAGPSTEGSTPAAKGPLARMQAGAQVNTVTSVAGKTGAVTLAKGDVGLGNVDNTSDADKPISTAVSTALSGKVDTSDTRLTDPREWTASTVSQAEAEAGTATTRRAWPAQRVKQAVVAAYNALTSVFGRTLASASDAAAARTALGLPTVAQSGSYNELSNKPSLGTAAAANVTTSNDS